MLQCTIMRHWRDMRAAVVRDADVRAWRLAVVVEPARAGAFCRVVRECTALAMLGPDWRAKTALAAGAVRGV